MCYLCRETKALRLPAQLQSLLSHKQKAGFLMIRLIYVMNYAVVHLRIRYFYYFNRAIFLVSS